MPDVRSYSVLSTLSVLLLRRETLFKFSLHLQGYPVISMMPRLMHPGSAGYQHRRSGALPGYSWAAPALRTGTASSFVGAPALTRGPASFLVSTSQLPLTGVFEPSPDARALQR